MSGPYVFVVLWAFNSTRLDMAGVSTPHEESTDALSLLKPRRRHVLLRHGDSFW